MVAFYAVIRSCFVELETSITDIRHQKKDVTSLADSPCRPFRTSINSTTIEQVPKHAKSIKQPLARVVSNACHDMQESDWIFEVGTNRASSSLT
jgi:hypothetical protein